MGEDGKEMSTTPDRSDIDIEKFPQHRNQDGRGQNDNVGNVQIIEREAPWSKKSTLSEIRLGKLQQCGNQVAKQNEAAPICRKYLGMFDESDG